MNILNKIETYEKMLESNDDTSSNKKAEIKIVLSIPQNIGKTQMNNWVKSKFKHVIEQGGVLNYDIKIKN